MGAYTAEILAELGHDAAEVAGLREWGVVDGQWDAPPRECAASFFFKRGVARESTHVIVGRPLEGV